MPALLPSFSTAKGLALVATALVVALTKAAPLEDRIDNLPGYGPPPTPQYSGYLDASEGCDKIKNGPICKIHYWLAMADDEHYKNDDSNNNNNKNKDDAPRPTVLWLNGGPGSSSLLGWLQEVGPLLLNATGGLMENPWAWTKANVNLLAIEAPMGVGFSYCSRQLEKKGPCLNTDTNTAITSRAALVDFFANKFPELYDGGFYIAGESYAGVYIPTLSRQLLTNKAASEHVPLKGVLVGDPCTDNAAQKDSMDSMWYSQKYGLMDNEVYDVLQSEECSEYRSMATLKLMKLNAKTNAASTTTTTTPNKKEGTHSSKSHQSIGKKWSGHVTAAHLNEELMEIEDLEERRLRAEDLYKERVLGIVEDNNDNKDKDEETNNNKNSNLRMASSTIPADGVNVNANDGDDQKCKLAYRKFLMSSSNSLSQGWKDMYIDDYSLFAPISSKEDEQMAEYFNRDDVRKALHVTDTPSEEWPMSSVGFSYTKEYNACNWQPDIKFPNTTMVDVYRQIVPLLDNVWVYNGDTDPCVSYEGTREAVKQILKPELDGGSYRPWFYRQEAASLEVLAEKSILFGPGLVAQTLEEAQFAGEVTSYEDGLAFVTFHGSGHMVPQFRPQSSLHFLKRFLYASSGSCGAGQELSPLLPKNATLVGLSEEDFEQAMDEWTESAKAMADAK
jgi:carboxypeptidase C (cathepsin A)